MMKELQSGGSLWRYDAEVFSSLESNTFNSDLFRPDYWKHKDAIIGQSKGRGITWFLKHEEFKLVLKHYQRGGLFGKINRDRYLFSNWQNTRPYIEYLLLEEMINLDLPVPKPAAIQITKTGMFYRADLITHLIQDAKDLFQILKEAPVPIEIYKKIKSVIQSFHEAGIYHSDLNIHNILIDNSDKIWIIDFDKAEKHSPAAHHDQKVWSRLKRSFLKEREKAGAKIDGFEILFQN